MWYRALTFGLTCASALLVALALGLGYHCTAEKTKSSPSRSSVWASSEIQPRPSRVEAAGAEESKVDGCLGSCAVEAFYRDNPALKGRLTASLQAVLSVKLANLARHELRSGHKKAFFEACLRKRRKGMSGSCESLALTIGD